MLSRAQSSSKHASGAAVQHAPAAKRGARIEAGARAGMPAFVQHQCAQCGAEEPLEEPVATVAGEAAVQPMCADCAAEEAAGGGPPVQMWDCDEYDAPTCSKPVQTQCSRCGGSMEDEAPVQSADERKTTRGPAAVHRAAAHGLTNASAPLPHGDRIQSAFGKHDVSGVRTGIGGAAGQANEQMGSLAFTSGDQIGFRQEPDLRLASHEAAHVVQQRAGLKLPGNVGRPGDPYERHADRVADAVVAGESAEPVLDEMTGDAGPKSADAAGETVQSQITSGASHEVEPEPEAKGEGGDEGAEAAEGEGEAAEGEGEATAEAAEGELEAAEEQTEPETHCEEADDGEASEDEQAGQSQASGEQQQQRPRTKGGCFPYDWEEEDEDAEDPDTDEQSSEVEEEAEVSYGDWEEPNDACECEVSEALQQEAAQIPPEVSPESAAATGVLAEQGAEGEGESAASGEQAPEGGEGGEGGEGQAAEGEGEAESASDIPLREAERDAAVMDYDAAQSEVQRVPGRARELSERLSFKETPRGSAADDARREAALDQVRAFLAQSAAQIDDAVGFAVDEAPARIGATADAVKAEIGAAMAQEKAAISSRIAAARELAAASAEGARAQIEAEHAASVAVVNTETDAALQALQAERATSTETITAREDEALQEVNDRFATAREDHVFLGDYFGDDAIALGQEHVDLYEENCKYNDEGESYEDDGFFIGCLSMRRKRAQQDAACKTAEGTYENMVKTARKKGFDLREKRTQYRCALIGSAGQSLATMDTTVEQLTSGLERGRTGVLDALGLARDMNVRAVEAALAATLENLAKQERMHRQAVNDAGYSQQVSVEQLAHAAAAGVARGVTAAMETLEGTLGALREQITAGDAPDPEALAEMLASADAGLSEGMGTLLDAMQERVVSAEEQLTEAGASAFEALLAISQKNEEMTATGEARFAE